jgi:hypothetical protein
MAMGDDAPPDWKSVRDAIEPYDGDDSDRAWVILFPEDYDNWMKDGVGNLALLVDEEQAEEVRRLADQSLTRIREGADDDA